MHRIVMVLMIVGCWGGGKTSSMGPESASDEVAVKAPAAAPGLVELADITIDESPNVITYLHSDGSVVREAARIGTVHLGVLSPDGTFKAQLGSSGRLQADGTYVADDGEVRFRLVGQALVIDNWSNGMGPGRTLTITIAPDGLMRGAPGAFIKVKGATTPSLVRTALLTQGVLATAR